MQLQALSTSPQALRPAAEKPSAADQTAAPVNTVAPDALNKPAAAAPGKDEQVNEAVQNINKTMQAMGQKLEFSVDEESKRTIVKVVDERTREVIRQMPSQEALEIAKALDRLQGLLIRQTA